MAATLASPAVKSTLGCEPLRSGCSCCFFPPFFAFFSTAAGGAEIGAVATVLTAAAAASALRRLGPRGVSAVVAVTAAAVSELLSLLALLPLMLRSALFRLCFRLDFTGESGMGDSGLLVGRAEDEDATVLVLAATAGEEVGADGTLSLLSLTRLATGDVGRLRETEAEETDRGEAEATEGEAEASSPVMSRTRPPPHLPPLPRPREPGVLGSWERRRGVVTDKEKGSSRLDARRDLLPFLTAAAFSSALDSLSVVAASVSCSVSSPLRPAASAASAMPRRRSCGWSDRLTLPSWSRAYQGTGEELEAAGEGRAEEASEALPSRSLILLPSAAEEGTAVTDCSLSSLHCCSAVLHFSCWMSNSQDMSACLTRSLLLTRSSSSRAVSN